MRLIVSLFGCRVLEISTEPDAPPSAGSALEASGGGQFELGFHPPPEGLIRCREQERR